MIGWLSFFLNAVITSFISDVCISYFFLAGIKYQNQKQIKAGSLFWHTFPEGQAIVHQGRHSVSRSRKSADHIFIHKQETEIANRKWGEDINPQARLYLLKDSITFLDNATHRESII